jgi:hypothetical protein
MAAVEVSAPNRGVGSYYVSKIDELEALLRDKTTNLRRLEAQRNELNSKGVAVLCVQFQRAFLVKSSVAASASPHAS